MSAIINYSLRVDKLPKEKFIAGKDGAVYVNLTMSVNDETRYGNNASIMILAQSSGPRALVILFCVDGSFMLPPVYNLHFWEDVFRSAVSLILLLTYRIDS